jgi:cytosine/adenosine deaminase-related metal-dependent hydrolase
MFEDKGDSIRGTLRYLKEWRRKGDGRVLVWFGPRPVGNCTEETYKEIAELARENRTGVTIHHSEVKEQVSYCRKKYGMLPTEYMKKVGLVGKNIVYAHCIFLTEREIEIMRKTRTNCSHVPSSDMKLAMGTAPVSNMLKAGVNVSLGCNGGANNNTYDMLRELSRACLLQRVVTRNPLAVSNIEALEMATINGAKAVGLEDQIGSIEVGKKADLILVDCTKPHMQPLLDPVAALVHCASGADVGTTIVDGRVLMRKRKVLSVKADEVVGNAKDSLLAVLERAGMKETLLR